MTDGPLLTIDFGNADVTAADVHALRPGAARIAFVPTLKRYRLQYRLRFVTLALPAGFK
jgi:hypothetical protein